MRLDSGVRRNDGFLLLATEGRKQRHAGGGQHPVDQTIPCSVETIECYPAGDSIYWIRLLLE
jgi:hypothetical protein